MNMRKKERFAQLMADHIRKIDLNDSSMLVVSFPDGIQHSLIEMLQRSLAGALKTLDKDTPVLIMPNSISINELSEGQMNRLGWRRDATLTQGYTDMRRLQRDDQSSEGDKDLRELREIWEDETPDVPTKGDGRDPRFGVGRYSCG